MMIWHSNYPNERSDVLDLFVLEQDYIDFIFMLIVMSNFGVYVDTRHPVAY